MVALKVARILLLALVPYVVAYADWPLVQMLWRNNNNNAVVAPSMLKLSAALCTEGNTDANYTEEIFRAVELNSTEEIKTSLRDIASFPTGDGIVLKSATLIFANHSVTPGDGYSQSISTYYNTNFTNINFANARKATCCINERINETSSGTIERMVDKSDVIGSDAIIANFLYFTGRWKTPFTKSIRGEFKRDDGTSVECTYMVAERACFKRFYSTTMGTMMMSIPYVNENYTLLLVFFPNGELKVSKLVKIITKEILKRYQEAMTVVCAPVAIPMFTLDIKMNFNNTLMSLGVDDSVLSKLGRGSPGDVTRIYQRVAVHVNNRNTTFAKEFMVNSRGVYFNYPFLFFIQHQNKSFLAGQLLDPSESQVTPLHL